MPVRQAQSSDFIHVHALIAELALFEKAPNEVITSPETLENACNGKSPLAWCWVAEDSDGTIVGAAVCYVRYSTWKGPVFYLEDLIVSENHRRNGWGRKLLNAIIEFAQEKGYSRVQWQVLDWNQSAIEFYRQFNAHFDGEWINVHIEI